MQKGFKTFEVQSIVSGEYQLHCGSEVFYIRAYRGIIKDCPQMIRRFVGQKIDNLYKELKKIKKIDKFVITQIERPIIAEEAAAA